jgi:F-type H+-transporting ATPase subunit b
MDAALLADPVFIAKVIDFVIFVAALVWLWNKYGEPMLVAQQEAQNKIVEDAARYRAEADQALRDSQDALERVTTDAAHMIESGTAQAARLIAQERTAAQEHANRILSHASGELDRERYRVRRELLEDTVERAHTQAREIVKRELDVARQRTLLERAIANLERAHA